LRARHGVIRAFARPARGGRLLLLGLLVGVFVASAQAATSTKFYSVTVTPDAVEVGLAVQYTVTLTNSTASTQTLGSANVTVPANFSVVTPSSTATASGGQAWTANYNAATRAIEFRAASSKDAILPGQTVSTVIEATASATGDFTWATAARQSNNFSGPPGNSFIREGADPVVSVYNELCTNSSPTCLFSNGITTVETAPPTAGTIGLSLGPAGESFNCNGTKTAVGSIALIDPSDPVAPYDVTVTYTSSPVNHNNLDVCLSKDGVHYTQLANCSSSVPPAAELPCVLDRDPLMGGVRIIVRVSPEDPYVGGS
jgi:hypothetical protein